MSSLICGTVMASTFGARLTHIGIWSPARLVTAEKLPAEKNGTWSRLSLTIYNGSGQKNVLIDKFFIFRDNHCEISPLC